MEQIIHQTICDICGRIENTTFDTLSNDDSMIRGQSTAWHKYYYSKSWHCGIHRGKHDVELIVCNKCDQGRGLRHLFYK